MIMCTWRDVAKGDISRSTEVLLYLHSVRVHYYFDYENACARVFFVVFLFMGEEGEGE